MQIAKGWTVMFDSVATLVSERIDFDELGNEKIITAEKQIFCNKKSVNQSEFFKASEAGLKPQLMILVFAVDYNGENKIKVDDKVYYIYRTYQKTKDKLELYLSTKLADGVQNEY